jgi:hypothetical protein
VLLALEESDAPKLVRWFSAAASAERDRISSVPALAERLARAVALHLPAVAREDVHLVESVVAWAESAAPVAGPIARRRAQGLRGEAPDVEAVRTLARDMEAVDVPLALALWCDAGLFDEARALAVIAISAEPVADDVRMAVADVHRRAGEALLAKDRAGAVAAFEEAFRAMEPRGTETKPRRSEHWAYNALVTLVRSRGLPLTREYRTTFVSVADTVTYRLPETKRWSRAGSDVTERFQRGAHFRTLGFTRSGLGESAAKVAKLEYAEALKRMEKVAKKSAPARKKWNDQIANGIELTVEGRDALGVQRRVRCYVVDVPSGRFALVIRVDESPDLPADDPEYDALVASMRLVGS